MCDATEDYFGFVLSRPDAVWALIQPVYKRRLYLGCLWPIEAGGEDLGEGEYVLGSFYEICMQTQRC